MGGYKLCEWLNIVMYSTNECKSVCVVINNYRESCTYCCFLNELQINEVTTESIVRKKRFLEALGRKLYNRKFSLPPVPNTSNEGSGIE